jgi:dTDP-4-dehydrorhamnose reductase
MTYFIFGKNSMVAKRLARRLNSGMTVRFISSHPQGNDLNLDLLEPKKFDYSVFKQNDYIVVLASISSPDICEKEYELAKKINLQGTKHFIKSALDRQAKVVFFSSDTIYGNLVTKIDELTKCQPLGKYASMKLEVEQTFLAERNFKSLRLSYVFAKQDKFTGYLQHCREKSTPAEVFHPLYRRVVYIEDLLDAILLLPQKWDEVKTSTMNICGPELISRLDMAKAYQTIVDKRLEFKIIEPDEEFFQARPRSIDMSSLFFADLIGRQPLTLEQAIIKEFEREV